MNATAESLRPQAADGVLRLAATEGVVAPAREIAELPGPSALPWLGNALQVTPGAMHATLEGWAAQFGPFFRVKLGGAAILVVSDPVLTAAILRHRPREFGRSARLSSIVNALGPPGLFSAEGEQWRRQRRLVMRALTPAAISHFLPVLQAVTERLRARWRAAAASGNAVDVTRDLKRFAIDVATWLAMGVDVDTLRHPDNPLQGDVELWFATIGRRLSSPIPYWRWIRLPADRRAEVARERLRVTIEDLIAKARARLAADPQRREKPANILVALLVARDEPDSEFTDDDVRGNVTTLLFAGEDTAANAMAWLMLHLALSPEPTAKAGAEADAVLGEASLVERFADLDRLEYLEAAATESMRLKPVAPMIGATAFVDCELAGLRVPRGQSVMMLQRPTATDPAVFPEPYEFRPERWLGEHAERADDTHRRVFPFGGGPRYCPGRYLAMVEIKMVVAMALREFRFALAEDPAKVVERFTFTLGPQALPIRFTPRGAAQAG